MAVLLGSVSEESKRKLLDAIYILGDIKNLTIDINELGIKDANIKKDLVSMYKKIVDIESKLVKKYKY